MRIAKSLDRPAKSKIALLASASLFVAFSLVSAVPALAGCGATVHTGTNAASAGTGGVHTGSSAPHVSGGSSCPTNGTAASASNGVHLANGPSHFSASGGHAWTHSASNNSHPHSGSWRHTRP
jgi:hypothetical protein